MDVFQAFPNAVQTGQLYKVTGGDPLGETMTQLGNVQVIQVPADVTNPSTNTRDLGSQHFFYVSTSIQLLNGYKGYVLSLGRFSYTLTSVVWGTDQNAFASAGGIVGGNVQHYYCTGVLR